MLLHPQSYSQRTVRLEGEHSKVRLCQNSLINESQYMSLALLCMQEYTVLTLLLIVIYSFFAVFFVFMPSYLLLFTMKVVLASFLFSVSQLL